MVNFLKRWLKQISHKTNNEQQTLTKEVERLIQFLYKQFKGQDLPTSLRDLSKTLLKKENNALIEHLPEFYLTVEQYLFGIEEATNQASRLQFRQQVGKQFPTIIAFPNIGFIFRQPNLHAIYLCKFFLMHILQEVIIVLGQVQDRYFEMARVWVDELPTPGSPFPYLPDADFDLANLSDHLVDASLQMCATLERKMGSAFTQRVYDKCYNLIAKNYRFLNSFPVIISLIPKKHLSIDKVGLLSKHQLETTILEKVTYLEKLNNRLADRNEALYQAQLEVQMAKNESEEAYLQLREVMNAVGDGIITSDANSKIIMVNQMVEKIWGYKKEELIGQPLSILMPERFRKRHEKGMTRFLETRKSVILNQNVQMVGLRRDGSEFPMEINISDLEFKGSFLFTAAVRDITDRIASENKLKHSNEQLEQRTIDLEKTQRELEITIDELKTSNRDLEQFAYVASHDLQEPLRSVEGYVSVIKRRLDLNSDNDLIEFVGLTEEGLKRMQSLINDLLEYSRVGRTNILKYEKVDLATLIELVKFNLGEIVYSSKAIIDFKGPAFLLGDKTMLTQLFQNLISNGIKFSKKEGIPKIEISGMEQKEKWIFQIKDNGIGMDEKDLDRIFEVFQRLHPRSRYYGTGIGLAICKRIVERHGGEIWAKSKLGKGTTIYFTLRQLKDRPVLV